MIIDPYRFAAPAIQAAWAASPSVNSILSESNRRFEADSSGSGTYGNVVTDVCLANLGYYSVHVESPGGENAGVGIGYYRTDFDASNSSRWVGDGASGNTAVGAWLNTGSTYRNGGLLGALGGSDSGDFQFAVRRASGGWRIWIRKDGGDWNNVAPFPGSPDPVLDTGPIYTLTDAGETRIELRGTITRSGATSARFIRLHGNASETTGTVPSGFTAAKFVLP